MCLAVPARILTVHGAEGDADIGGIVRRIGLAMTPGAGVGDHVLVHAGYAIAVLDEQEARESLELIRQLSGSEGLP